MKKIIYLNILLFIITFGLLLDNKINYSSTISFLNIGQGDSTLLQSNLGEQILIDCGPPNGPILDRLQTKLGYFDNKIDILIITHGDNDHYGGCKKVLDNYNVSKIMINGIIDTQNQDYTNFINEIKKTESVIPAFTNTFITFNEYEIQILNPDHTYWGEEVKDDNEHSIVMNIKSPSKQILLTGDIPSFKELNLMNQYPNLNPDILKISHHGSKHSTSKLFLEKLDPKQAIISAGEKNSFNHPDPSVIDNLNEKNIEILETKNYNNSIDITL